jgi:hypothetical protein
MRAGRERETEGEEGAQDGGLSSCLFLLWRGAWRSGLGLPTRGSPRSVCARHILL